MCLFSLIGLYGAFNVKLFANCTNHEYDKRFVTFSSYLDFCGWYLSRYRVRKTSANVFCCLNSKSS